MASRSEVVHCYDRLAFLLSNMLELAVARDWEQLPELELQCVSLIERLKQIEPLEQLDGVQRQEVARLMAVIRHDHETVLGLVRPQLERLLRKMHELNIQNNLDRAYRLLP